MASYERRSGSTRETSSCSLCETTRTRRYVTALHTTPPHPLFLFFWVEKSAITNAYPQGDVILKYSADEARSLKAYGELPETAKINETDTYGDQGDEGIGFEFDEDRDSSSEEEGGKDGKDIDIDDI